MATQKETAKQIWDYLTTRGWTQEAVAGVLGNMQSESGIVADIWEGGQNLNLSVGYGLVQWTPASKYIDWANANGLAYRDVISQCKRIEWEVANNVQFAHPSMTFKQFTQSAQSPEVLAELFIRYYERPLNPNQPIRQTQARYWYEQFKNGNKATIDTNNVNSAAFHIAGWFVPQNSVAGQSIWLYFMDSTTDKELARVQGTRTFRDDVAQVFPNPNGNHVGFSFSAVTPRVLMGKKYYIMLRYSSAKDEIYMREKVYTAPAIVNQATLDEATVSGSTLTLRGWHVSSLRQNSYKHLMFLLENGKEVARFDATADSFQKSDDVASTFSSTIGQRSTSRFNTKYTIPASLKGKTITVLSRYAEGTLGTHSNSINYTFSKQIKL